VNVTEGDRAVAAFLTSLRYYWGDVTPRTHSRPLYRLRISSDGVKLAPVPLPLTRNRPVVDARWEEIEKIEWTGNGIRLLFVDGRRPVVAATLTRQRKLADTVMELAPVAFDRTRRPGTWSSV
jgi:hypothetical protein